MPAPASLSYLVSVLLACWQKPKKNVHHASINSLIERWPSLILPICYPKQMSSFKHLLAIERGEQLIYPRPT